MRFLLESETQTLADEKHVALLQKGVKAWNQWRAHHPDVTPDLSVANLSVAKLGGAHLGRAILHLVKLSFADLRRADLGRADLHSADLVRANLCLAELSGANLREANLTEADLREADLDGADLREADLSSADFREARLHEANLRGAQMSGTILTRVDLSTVKGLEAVRHNGPSSIGIDTIYLSKGTIPHAFLRGAGVPDNFIEYMSSLTGKAFEFYSCFISYSSRDQDFAARLYSDLQANGVRCWFAPHDVQSGKKLHEQIDAAIRVHERLLLILSPDSIDSEWVKTEIAKARQREVKEKKRVLFPVRLRISFDQLRDWEYFDADIGKSSAREIREYYIPDFSRWKSHDSYQEEFAKLLRDLKKAGESRAAIA